MCVHSLGSRDEHTHEACRGRVGINIQGWSPEVQRTCSVCALCLLSVTCFSVLYSHSSHISAFPNHPSTLCSEHTPLIVPASCLSHTTLPPDSCSLNLEHSCSLLLLHPLFAPTALAAFKSLIKRCPVCKGFLSSPTVLCLHCLLSPVLFSFVQMFSIRINLFTYLFPTSQLEMKARKDHLFSYM